MQRCLGCMQLFDDGCILCPHCGYICGSEPEETNQLAPGTRLQNRYTLGRALGRGGFGITYIAWDERLHQALAIKEYLPSVFASRDSDGVTVSCYSMKALEAFNAGLQKTLEESRILAHFTHLNAVVNVQDCFEENNTAYIVMELLRGETVSQILQRTGALPLAQVMRIMEPVLETLSEIHKTHLIHRDIAPDNIFVCNNGQVKLLDFGAARVYADLDEQTLSVILKHGYAPIEQYSNHSRQGTYTDVYAAGATMYKMLTGITPPSSLDRLQQDNLRPAGEAAQIPHYVRQAIVDSMALQPSQRTQTVQQFLAQLHSETGRKTGASRTAPAPRRRSTARTIAIAAAVVLALAGAAFAIRQSLPAHRLAPAAQTETAVSAWEQNEGGTAQTSPPLYLLTPDSVTASSDQGKGKYGRSYGAEKAADGDFNTCWMVSGKQNGEGGWIELQFDTPRTIHSIALLNGNGWDGWYQGEQVESNLFSLNGRVRDFTLTFDGGAAKRFTAEDVREEVFGVNRFELDAPVTARRVRLTIDTGYSGSRWTTVCCLSEFAVFGE